MASPPPVREVQPTPCVEKSPSIVEIGSPTVDDPGAWAQSESGGEVAGRSPFPQVFVGPEAQLEGGDPTPAVVEDRFSPISVGDSADVGSSPTRLRPVGVASVALPPPLGALVPADEPRPV